jgi:hypothetical protein
MLLPSMHLVTNARSTLASVPDVLMRGTAVVCVFAAFLGATGFFHPGEIAALRALRRRGGRPPAMPRAPDSTEMAGDIVATDMAVPTPEDAAVRAPEDDVEVRQK